MSNPYGIPGDLPIERVDIAQPANMGGYNHEVSWSSVLTVDPKELDEKIKEGWLEWGVDWPGGVERTDDGIIVLGSMHNLVVTQGFVRVQNLGWAIGGALQAVNAMGLDNGTGTPSSADVKVGAIPVGDTSTTAARIQAFDSAATQSAAGVVSQTATYTQATVGFVMKHLSLNFIAAGSLPVNSNGPPVTASTNAAVLSAVPNNSLHSVTAPFTIDLTSFTTWSQAITATITGSGT